MADSAGVGSPQPGDGAADGYVQVQPAGYGHRYWHEDNFWKMGLEKQAR